MSDRPAPFVLDDLAAPRFSPDIERLLAGMADGAAVPARA